MPCLIGCLALAAPRVALVLVWLFSDYLGRAYEQMALIWPILGFIFLPVTTLAYAFAMNHAPLGTVEGFELVVLVLAVLLDLGIIGSSAKSKQRRVPPVEVRVER